MSRENKEHVWNSEGYCDRFHKCKLHKCATCGNVNNYLLWYDSCNKCLHEMTKRVKSVTLLDVRGEEEVGTFGLSISAMIYPRQDENFRVTFRADTTIWHKSFYPPDIPAWVYFRDLAGTQIANARVTTKITSLLADQTGTTPPYEYNFHVDRVLLSP